MTLNCGLVAGELSGDLLATSLLKAIVEQNQISVTGILGPNSLAFGRSLYPMELLSVMGLWQPLKRLPTLYSVRKNLIAHFLEVRPHVFIGVDAPDFNLGLEKALKKNNIKTVHLVSPSVWAWRQYRIHGIKKSCDLMLCLFPFEMEFYKKYQMSAVFIGHPFADEIDLKIDIQLARNTLSLDAKQVIIGIFPGSRDNELSQVLNIYLQSALQLQNKIKNVLFIVAAASERHQKIIKKIILESFPSLNITVLLNKTRTIMQAINAAMVTSGTACLELMLCKKPMVVGYKMPSLSFLILKSFIKLPYISLPNLLLKKKWVPELIQSDLTPKNMTHEILIQLKDTAYQTKMLQAFVEMHRNLKRNASYQAAAEILQIINY